MGAEAQAAARYLLTLSVSLGSLGPDEVDREVRGGGAVPWIDAELRDGLAGPERMPARLEAVLVEFPFADRQEVARRHTIAWSCESTEENLNPKPDGQRSACGQECRLTGYLPPGARAPLPTGSLNVYSRTS